MEDLLAKLRILLRAESFVLRLHLRRMTLQGTLIAAGLLLLLLAVIMFNLAAYTYLVERMAAHAAASIIGLINGVLALLLILVATRVGPSSEMRVAEELRDLAWKHVQTDTDQVGRTIAGLRSNVEAFRASLGAWGSGGPNLLQLAPLMQSAIRTLRWLLRRK